jgi:hypothetical protein
LFSKKNSIIKKLTTRRTPQHHNNTTQQHHTTTPHNNTTTTPQQHHTTTPHNNTTTTPHNNTTTTPQQHHNNTTTTPITTQHSYHQKVKYRSIVAFTYYSLSNKKYRGACAKIFEGKKVVPHKEKERKFCNPIYIMYNKIDRFISVRMRVVHKKKFFSLIKKYAHIHHHGIFNIS